MNDYMKLIVNAIKAWIPVKSVNGKTGDIILNAKDIGAQPKGEYVLIKDILKYSRIQSDWNQIDDNKPDYIKNRTHGEDIEYIEYAKIQFYEHTDNFVIYSDSGVPANQFNGRYFSNSSGIGKCIETDDGNYEVTFPNGECLHFGPNDSNDSSIIIYYFEYGKTGSDTVYLLNSTIKTLDEKFIPSTIPVISTATVGQTIIVKAVDENGKPTEWEMVTPITEERVIELINTHSLQE